MSTERASAKGRANAFSHVAKASWGKGVGTLWRIMRLNLRHPWQVTIAIGSTFIAATLQLMIPRLLGQAVDQAQGLGTAGAAATQALWTTAVLLLIISIARGIFTLLQNYYSESVGHHAAYELRLATYEKLQQLSFSFHDRVHSGDLITLGILDIDGVRMFFATAAVRFILLTVLIGVGAYLLISTDWLLVNSIARAATCGMRLFGLLDLELAVKDKPNAPELKITDGTLVFDRVSFRYPGTTRDVLRDVSFTARKGQTIALVGPPGSGKSSLVHLIPRYYDVGSGSITIDGQNVAEVTLDSLRRQVAVVQQDSFLFTTTIENNIAYGNPWAMERRIERAAESAQLHNYVVGLPAGYETIVGERGVSLSGGQRQRLTIARSLVLKPAIMVFDDSTAAIDAATEQRIRLGMRRFAQDRVTIIISHRLSSLMHADQILFIEDGQIVERGSHLELLARKGKYRSLYDLQVRPETDAPLLAGE